MRHVVFSLVLLSVPALADPQFVTLERVDRESRIGLQGSLQFYPELENASGFRAELFGQLGASVRPAAYLGAYGHLAFASLHVPNLDRSATGNLEVGGFYIGRLGLRTDLAFHLGLSVPTGSDDTNGAVVNHVAHLDRHYDLVNATPGTTALNFGITLRTPLSSVSFVQGDLAVDLASTRTFHDRTTRSDSGFFHGNLGVGIHVGTVMALLAEVAVTVAGEDFLGSLGLGVRFPSPTNLQVGYVMAFSGDEFQPVGRGLIAHMLTFGFYVGIR
jgi:hypothetical protein